MSIMFNEICINEEMLPIYIYIYIYIYNCIETSPPICSLRGPISPEKICSMSKTYRPLKSHVINIQFEHEYSRSREFCASNSLDG